MDGADTRMAAGDGRKRLQTVVVVPEMKRPLYLTD